jgi:hypothetical protein
MFGKNHLIIALAGTASAVRVQREPLLSNSKVLEVHQKPIYSDHAVDYAVADFGLDHETRYTLNNIKLTEALMKHKLNFMNDSGVPAEDDFNKDYKVADFGVDDDVKNVGAAIGNAETRLG